MIEPQKEGCKTAKPKPSSENPSCILTSTHSRQIILEVAGNDSEGIEQEPAAPVRTNRVDVLDGVRVISALVVMFHHIPALDESLLSGFSEDRLLGTSDDLSYHDENGHFSFASWLFKVGPGNIAVETFLVLSGFVASFPSWRKSTLKPYERSLLKRFFRIGLPLIPVHIVNVILWHTGTAYGNYYNFPSSEAVAASYNKGLSFVFASELNGALWIVKAFFVAPFVSLGVQLPVLELKAKARCCWYALCLAFLIGNGYETETISPYLSVVIGVVLADMQSNSVVKQYIGWKILFLASFMVFFPWLPQPLYAHRLSMVVSASSFTFLALFMDKVHCVFDNAFMRRCSKYTYELYIWHLVIYNAFGASIIPNSPVGGARWGLYVAAFIVSVVVGIVAFWIIEKPCNTLINRFANYIYSMQK